MKSYVVLLRGINVGGKNKIAMAALRAELELAGFQKVTTYIASGNVILSSELPKSAIKSRIEAMLSDRFQLDSVLIKVAVLSKADVQQAIDQKPAGFGDKPGMYHSDVIFLIDISVAEAMKVFRPREGVDQVWPGPGVIYSTRLSAERTKSRLGAIVGTPAYAAMTIRTWNTIRKLQSLLSN